MGRIPVDSPRPSQGIPPREFSQERYEGLLRIKEREARLAEQLSNTLNQQQPKAVIPCPQWQLYGTSRPSGRRAIPRPDGWPAQDLIHTLEAADLYDGWFAARKEGILLTQQTEPSTSPVPGVHGKFIPSRWAIEWYALYMEWLKEKAKYKMIDSDRVVDTDSFEKWWRQPKRPEAVTLGMLQYTFPEPGSPMAQADPRSG